MLIKTKVEKAIQLARHARRASVHSILCSSDFMVTKVDQFGFNIVVKNGDDVSKSLVLYGTYEPHLTRAMRKCIERDSCVLDIGANIGFISLLSAVLAPEGRIYSFEPDPRNFSLLMSSIYLNGFKDRVLAYNYAVSDHEGSVLLTNLDDKNSGGRVASDSLEDHTKFFGNLRYEESRTVVLDSFLDVNRLDVVKIDIEGYEPKAMRGMKALIQKYHPKIFSEFAPSNLSTIGGTSPTDYLDFFVKMGYEVAVLDFVSGEIKAFGADSTSVLHEQERQNVHHLDILFEWRG